MEGAATQFVVWVETMIAGQSVAVQRAAVVERQCLANVPTKLGLTLQDGRAILTGIEQEVVQSQVELQSGAASVCEHCQVRLRIKDIRRRRLDTVFGRVTVSCRRFNRCTCRGGMPHSIWPLASWGLPGMKRSTPERMYLFAEWGSKLPYRRAAELLNEMPPGLNREISHTAIRRHTLAVGALLDKRIIEPDEYAFIAHQYYRLHDNLVDVLLSSLQSFQNGAQREHKEQCYVRREQRNDSLKTLVGFLDHGVLETLAKIKSATRDSVLTDTEKVHRIRSLLASNPSATSLDADQIDKLKAAVVTEL